MLKILLPMIAHTVADRATTLPNVTARPEACQRSVSNRAELDVLKLDINDFKNLL